MENKKCYFCEGNLKVEGIFDPKVLGIEEKGIFINLICEDCGASWEGLQIHKEKRGEK